MKRARVLRADPSRGPRQQLLDTAVLVGLGVVAMSAFGPAFGGWRYLLVGGLGVVLGAGSAFLVTRLGRSAWWTAALVTVLFVLVGVVLVVPGSAAAGVLPTPQAVGDLMSGATRGWHNLLSTVAPVGQSGSLMAVPWVAGLVCGAVSVTIALRARRWAVSALVVPAAVLLLGIIEGTDEQAWAAQASVLFAASVLWGSYRQRAQRASTGAGALTRLASAAAMVAVAAVIGSLLASWSPIRGGVSRTVVRDQVKPPPEDVLTVSPLESFRRYRNVKQRDAVLRVDGLKPGDRIRLATMDRFDGESWRVDPDGGFKRVGATIAGAEGRDRTVTITSVGYDGPWVPVPEGSVSAVRFVAPRDRVTDLSEGLRLHTDTGTLADVKEIEPGTGLEVVASGPVDVPGSGEPGVGSSEAVEQVPAVSKALTLLRGANGYPTGESRLEQLRFIQKVLVGDVETPPVSLWDPMGYMSNGRPEDKLSSDAGHGAVRISAMLGIEVAGIEGSQYRIGNEEQFASLIALLARELGFPARVVMGFQVPVEAPSGVATLTGQDVTAWVEVLVDGEGWVPLHDSAPPERQPSQENPKPKPPIEPLVQPPPATTTTLPNVRTASGEDCRGDACAEVCTGFDVPGACLPAVVGTVSRLVLPPVLVIGGITALMGALKASRRRRRRSTGAPDRRVAAGWEEVCDLARDLGDVVPDRATRREAAVLLGRPGLPDLARAADGLVFSPVALDDRIAEHYWDQVDLTRKAMLGPVSRWQRWKALVNPSSLRGSTESSGRFGAFVAGLVGKLPKLRRGSPEVVPG